MIDYTEVEKLKDRKEIVDKLKSQGVLFIDEDTVYIGEDVIIGSGSKIYPNVILEGNTQIGENCIIGMSTHIENTKIGDKSEVQMSVVRESEIGSNTTVGPFAYIRPGSKIGNGCKIGDFVEIKNSVIGDKSKASHLTYIGDADVGQGVNFGCGVVLVNYDGEKKYRSSIEDGAFVGCNSNLVSPVTVEKNAYIAAGSTVTKSVSENSLYVARAKGVEKKDWRLKKFTKK